MTMRNQIVTLPLSAFRDTWTPFSELFDDWMPTTTLDGWRTDHQFFPTCQLEETKNHYLIEVEIPGVKKDDIQVEFMDDQIVISGERKYSENRKNQGLRYSERSVGKFQRRFALPSQVDAEKVEAHYQDGVLRILLPKSESAKPRQIKITQGSGASSFFGKLFGPKEKEDERSSSETPQEKVAS